MLIKKSKKSKKDDKMGKVNENNPAFKLKQEMGVAKSRVVKFKVLVDNELADAIEFILANSKRATDIEPSVYFGKKILENNRKFIIDMKNGMKELLESEEQDEQTEVQNGASK